MITCPEKSKSKTLPTLESLTKPLSRELLDNLQTDNSFLEEDPEAWILNEAFCIAKKTIQKLPTVNDHAEPGVALIQDYNRQLTTKEDQLQYLLKVVEQHRKDFPILLKDILNI